MHTLTKTRTRTIYLWQLYLFEYCYSYKSPIAAEPYLARGVDPPTKHSGIILIKWLTLRHTMTSRSSKVWAHMYHLTSIPAGGGSNSGPDRVKAAVWPWYLRPENLNFNFKDFSNILQKIVSSINSLISIVSLIKKSFL